MGAEAGVGGWSRVDDNDEIDGSKGCVVIKPWPLCWSEPLS